MSACRELIEHNYGEADELFPFMTYKKKLKILANQPLGAIYMSKLLFRNMYVCLYNKTGDRFNCAAPYLEDYMV